MAVKISREGEATCGHGKIYCKGVCRSCYETGDVKVAKLAYLKMWRDNNHDKVVAARKKRYAESPEYRSAVQDKNFQRQYGITLEDRDRMLVEQRHLCAVCGKPETDKKNGKVIKLAIDHNHTTKKVRKLLCGKCNRAVGNLRDSSKIARAMADYLESHGS
jgi:hypothetical protein